MSVRIEKKSRACSKPEIWNALLLIKSRRDFCTELAALTYKARPAISCPLNFRIAAASSSLVHISMASGKLHPWRVNGSPMLNMRLPNLPGNYISMPPGMARGLSSSCNSEMRASVVSIKPAIDAAFCSAQRVTFAGSIMPADTRSSNFSFSTL